MARLVPQRKGSHIEVIIIRAILQHLTFNNDAIHLAALLSKGPRNGIAANSFFSPVKSIHLPIFSSLTISFIFNMFMRMYKLDLVRWMKRVKNYKQILWILALYKGKIALEIRILSRHHCV